MFRGGDGSSRLQPRVPRASFPLTGHRRLHKNMAKKRVHELAKQYQMPLPEVLKRLQAYGLDVKAAATAVDEKLADAALTGKPKPKAAANGAAKKAAAQPVIQQRAGFGHGTARAPRAENLAPEDPAEAEGQARRSERRQRRRPAPAADALLAAGRARPRLGRRRAPRRDRLAGLAPPGRPRWPGRRSRRRPGRRSPEPPAASARRPAPARHLRGARRAGRLRAEGRRHPRQLRLDGQGRRGVPRRAPSRRSSRS